MRLVGLCGARKLQPGFGLRGSGSGWEIKAAGSQVSREAFEAAPRARRRDPAGSEAPEQAPDSPPGQEEQLLSANGFTQRSLKNHTWSSSPDRWSTTQTKTSARNKPDFPPTQTCSGVDVETWKDTEPRPRFEPGSAELNPKITFGMSRT